jgi:hypothetical protein
MNTDPDRLSYLENQEKPPKKRRPLDPFLFMKLAILFFFVDYVAFQKPLPVFVFWLLIVTPLSFLATAFFLFAQRKQFPWFWSGIPVDPSVMDNLKFGENNDNVYYSAITFIIIIIIIFVITANIFFY